MNKISPVVVMGIFYKSGFVLFSTIQHKYWNQGWAPWRLSNCSPKLLYYFDFQFLDWERT